MKKIMLLLTMLLGVIPNICANIIVQTKVFDADSQPPIVGGVISNYSSNTIVKKGILVSIDNSNLIYDEQTEISDPYFYEDLRFPGNTYCTLIAQDFRVINCSDIGKEQFWCPLLMLKSDLTYYIRAYAVDFDGNITYGQIESLFSQSFDRYSGRADYANVFYAFKHTLFDLVTDEIINPNEGFYYSTNENPTMVRSQKGTGYNTCYKFLTEWNYKLWYYHSVHCNRQKMVNSPLMSLINGKIVIEKNPLDANKDITIFYSINSSYFRPEKYTNVYNNPIEITEPCVVYCYAISSDGYISYNNMYVVEENEFNQTGVETINSTDSVKDVIFNLQGLRMLSLQRGINIANRKKVLVR
jgi:hypothetical protein